MRTRLVFLNFPYSEIRNNTPIFKTTINPSCLTKSHLSMFFLMGLVIVKAMMILNNDARMLVHNVIVKPHFSTYVESYTAFNLYCLFFSRFWPAHHRLSMPSCLSQTTKMNHSRITQSRCQNEPCNKSAQDDVQDNKEVDEAENDELHAHPNPNNVVRANGISKNVGVEERPKQSAKGKTRDYTTAGSTLRSIKSSRGQRQADTPATSPRRDFRPNYRTVGSTIRSIAAARRYDQSNATTSSSRHTFKLNRRTVGPTLRSISSAQADNRSYAATAASHMDHEAGYSNQTRGISQHLGADPADKSGINTVSKQEEQLPDVTSYESWQLPVEICDRKYKFALCPEDAIPGFDPWNSLARKEWNLPRPPLLLSAIYVDVKYEDILEFLSGSTFIVARGDVAESLKWILDLPEDIRKLMKRVNFKPSSMDLNCQSRELPKAKVDLHLQKIGTASFTVPERYEMLHTLELRALEKVWRKKYKFLGRLDHIEDITFDFTDMQCRNRCCAAYEIALPAMRRIGAYGVNLPRRWNVRGVRHFDAFKDIILGKNARRSALMRGEFLSKYA